MKILGIKLTHDGGLALIDGNKLIFSYETEKLNNNPRYSEFKLSFFEVENILNSYNYKLSDIDKFIIDGWCNMDFTKTVYNNIDLGYGKFSITLHDYGEYITNENILLSKEYDYSQFGLKYKGYYHVSGHAIGSYCTSPFAKDRKSSFILVWDGAICPHLYYFDAEKKQVENLGHLFLISGIAYGEFARLFPPYDKTEYGNMGVAGKAMAYIALGSYNAELHKEFFNIYKEHESNLTELTGKNICFGSNYLLKKYYLHIKKNGYDFKDALTTFHYFIDDLLITSLKQKINQYPDYNKLLCYGGGCALNIKWNSKIRYSDIFDDVWVCPFPNDSGSAIGTACCEMITQTEHLSLDWDVYSGPRVIKNEPALWESAECSISTVAKIIYSTKKPVVILNGRAELGPRALGNRSIFAPPDDPAMKDLLNVVKERESYRPVAPICMEEFAKEIFEPGNSDPYMLFDHNVKISWQSKIPAIMHLDKTARLQTVNSSQNPIVYELLSEYYKLSGIPLLCNTSANFKGKGFFPDINSAIKWNGVDFIWSEGILYSRNGIKALNGFSTLENDIKSKNEINAVI